MLDSHTVCESFALLKVRIGLETTEIQRPRYESMLCVGRPDCAGERARVLAAGGTVADAGVARIDGDLAAERRRFEALAPN